MEYEGRRRGFFSFLFKLKNTFPCLYKKKKKDTKADTETEWERKEGKDPVNK